jgi:Flp pilus assembly protein TadD
MDTRATTYEQAGALGADRWQALCDHGARLAAAGDWPRARRVFQVVCLGHPLMAAAWVGLGACHEKMNEDAAAAAAYGLAQALGATHPGTLICEGACRARLGDRAGALALLAVARDRAAADGDEVTSARAQAALHGLSLAAAEPEAGPPSGRHRGDEGRRR